MQPFLSPLLCLAAVLPSSASAALGGARGRPFAISRLRGKGWMPPREMPGLRPAPRNRMPTRCRAMRTKPSSSIATGGGAGDDGDFIGIDRNGKIAGGFGGDDRYKRERDGKKFINYEVVALSGGSAAGSATDGIRDYMGQMRLPKNMNNGDRLEINGRDFVVIKTTINFMLMSGRYKKKHFLLVEPAHSYILSIAER